MSDGGTWNPPEPSSAVPPAPPPPTDHDLEPAQRPGRSRGKVIGAAVGAVAIVGAGVFAVTRIAGDDAAGGADTPEEAGLAFMEALGNEDALGVVDVMLPGERQALRRPLTELVDELRRLEVLSEDADPSAIAGVDLVVEDVSVDADETNVDDIVNLSITATVSGSLDGDRLPVGDWIRDELGDELAELDEQSDMGEEDTLGITAVREDGRWYLSMFHTLAESVRTAVGEAEIPTEGVIPDGGDSPEAAIDALLDAAVDLDVEAMIAALDPGEFQALQRYAPLFLADAQAELETAPFEVTITDRSYSVDGSGDTRSVSIDAITIEVTAEGESASMELRDGCWIITAPDVEETNSCDAADEVPALDEMFEDPQRVEDFITEAREAFADYENPGFVVRQVDGSWYLSPIATGTEQLLAVVRALSREEIEGLQERVGDLFEAFNEVGGLPVPSGTDEESLGTIPADPLDTTPTTDPADECWIESDAATAAACFEALTTAGEIDAAEMPWYLRYPECGLAEIGWSGDYYSLPDDEFTALVADVAPCFQALVDSGEAQEHDLSVEVLKPECLAGRNWYSATDEEYLAEFEECAFG